jgi:hypothetical protein
MIYRLTEVQYQSAATSDQSLHLAHSPMSRGPETIPGQSGLEESSPLPYLITKETLITLPDITSSVSIKH